MLWRAGGVVLGAITGVVLFQPVGLAAMLIPEEDVSELAYYLGAFALGGAATGYVVGNTLRRKVTEFRIRQLFEKKSFH